MATSSLLSFCSITRPYKPKVWKYPQTKSQSFHHEGNSTNKVDANLSVLRERIRYLRKKERLERDCRCGLENGWEYKAKAGYDDNMNNSSSCAMLLSESIKLAGLVSSALGIVFLSGSFCILLVFFVVHLCH